jgi:hypothetical protein
LPIATDRDWLSPQADFAEDIFLHAIPVGEDGVVDVEGLQHIQCGSATHRYVELFEELHNL